MSKHRLESENIDSSLYRVRRIAMPWLVATFLAVSPAFAESKFETSLPFSPDKEAFLEWMPEEDNEQIGKVNFFEANYCGQPRNLVELTPGAPKRLNLNAYRCMDASYKVKSLLDEFVALHSGDPPRLSRKSEINSIGLTSQDHSLEVIDSLSGGFCVGFCYGQSGSGLSRWAISSRWVMSTIPANNGNTSGNS